MFRATTLVACDRLSSLEWDEERAGEKRRETNRGGEREEALPTTPFPLLS